MKITKKGEYALEALLDLACFYGEKTLTLRELSVKNRIPYKFLEQIMMVLKRHGFVDSIKGKFGGYTLARSPKTITLGEIIRAVEGSLSPLATTPEIKKRAKQDKHPGLYVTFLEVRNAIADILDQNTLADVCDKSLELSGSKSSYQMYYI